MTDADKIGGTMIVIGIIIGFIVGVCVGEKGMVKDNVRCLHRFQIATTRTDTLQVALDNEGCATLLRLVERKDGAK